MTINSAYHLPKLPGQGAFSTSEIDANVFFTRNTNDEVIVVSSDSHAILGRWSLEAAAVSGTGSTIHSVSDVVKKSISEYAVRSAIVSSEDNWVMVRSGVPAWSRTEGLSGAVAAAWAEIPEGEGLAKTLEAEAHSSIVQAYIHRVTRHIGDLQYVAPFLATLPHKILSALFPAATYVAAAGPLARDSFGFRKLVIVATGRGRVYALDAGNKGKVVWSCKPSELAAGQHWDVKGVSVDNIKGIATIAGSRGELVRIQTHDGAIVQQIPRDYAPPVQSTALIDSEAGEWMLTIGYGGKMGALPRTYAPKHGLVVRGKDGEVKGIKFVPKGADVTPITIWTFKAAEGEKVVSVSARPVHDPVASIGRVLADRRVLYKYLNPNAILVTAISEGASTASFYLLDSVSGEVLYSTTHSSVDTTQPITSTLSENWFAYSLYSDIAQGSALPSAKGYQLIVSDLYESAFPNDRGTLDSATNFSSVAPSEIPFDEPSFPHVITAAFLIPEAITHMTVSATLQGITSKLLLCTLPALNGIVGIPRGLLDPRRPVGRAPTPGEAEEGLTQYQPFLDFDPKMVISHQREIIGVKSVLTTPSLLESTSLVFAYGVDVFGTKITPSMPFDILGKGFNKLNLVVTVWALFSAVIAVAPLVSFVLPVTSYDYDNNSYNKNIKNKLGLGTTLKLIVNR